MLSIAYRVAKFHPTGGCQRTTKIGNLVVLDVFLNIFLAILNLIPCEAFIQREWKDDML